MTTKIKRYGTSSMECENGCFVMFAELEKVVAECERLRARGTLLYHVAFYADSVCGMLRQGGWPGKAEALESRIKAVIEFDEAQSKEAA